MKKIRQIFIKVLSIFFIILVIASLILLIKGSLNPLYFWIIIAFCAIIAFFIIPKTREKK